MTTEIALAPAPPLVTSKSPPELVVRAGAARSPGMSSFTPSTIIRTRKRRINRRCDGS